MDLKKFSESKWFGRGLIAIGFLAAIFISFGLGIAVGFHKAKFSYDWGEHYDRNFGGPHHGIFGMFGEHDFMDAHGTFGMVLNVGSSTIIVNGRDGTEKTVEVSSSTPIRAGSKELHLSDLKTNDPIVVIGNPDAEGMIDAQFIRVMPQMSLPAQKNY